MFSWVFVDRGNVETKPTLLCSANICQINKNRFTSKYGILRYGLLIYFFWHLIMFTSTNFLDE